MSEKPPKPVTQVGEDQATTPKVENLPVPAGPVVNEDISTSDPYLNEAISDAVKHIDDLPVNADGSVDVEFEDIEQPKNGLQVAEPIRVQEEVVPSDQGERSSEADLDEIARKFYENTSSEKWQEWLRKKREQEAAARAQAADAEKPADKPAEESHKEPEEVTPQAPELETGPQPLQIEDKSNEAEAARIERIKARLAANEAANKAREERINANTPEVIHLGEDKGEAKKVEGAGEKKPDDKKAEVKPENKVKDILGKIGRGAFETTGFAAAGLIGATGIGLAAVGTASLLGFGAAIAPAMPLAVGLGAIGGAAAWVLRGGIVDWLAFSLAKEFFFGGGWQSIVGDWGNMFGGKISLGGGKKGGGHGHAANDNHAHAANDNHAGHGDAHADHHA